MITYLSSTPPLEIVALAVVIVGGFLIFYALRIKGDVSAELSHGKTILRIDAKARRDGGKNLTDGS